MSIHEYLKAIRQKSGLTQRALADLLRSDQGTISNIERGRNGTSFEFMQSWIEACGCRLSLDEDQLSVEERDMIGLFRAAQKEHRDAVMVLLRAALCNEMKRA